MVRELVISVIDAGLGRLGSIGLHQIATAKFPWHKTWPLFDHPHVLCLPLATLMRQMISTLGLQLHQH